MGKELFRIQEYLATLHVVHGRDGIGATNGAAKMWSKKPQEKIKL
ncbi:MAG: hypothetical protein ACKVOK_15085 [Flavobacteriales bacterium]